MGSNKTKGDVEQTQQREQQGVFGESVGVKVGQKGVGHKPDEYDISVDENPTWDDRDKHRDTAKPHGE